MACAVSFSPARPLLIQLVSDSSLPSWFGLSHLLVAVGATGSYCLRSQPVEFRQFPMCGTDGWQRLSEAQAGSPLSREVLPRRTQHRQDDL